MAAAKVQPVRRKETGIFTWKIENFSKLKEPKLYSDTFVSGGHRWKIRVYPKGDGAAAVSVSVYIHFADSENMLQGWSVLADFTLTVVDKLEPTSSVKHSSKRHFSEWSRSWGWKRFVPLADVHDPRKGFLVNDTLIIQFEVCTEVAAAASSLSESVSVSQGSQVRVDGTAAKASVDGPFYPSVVQSTSRSLIAELSSMISSASDSDSEHDSPTSNPDLLLPQWEKLDGFLDMSLEAMSEAKSLDQVESIADKLAEHANDPVKKTVLKDLISRLPEFKETIPSSLSTIEASMTVESSVAVMKKKMEARLVRRKRQLSSLEDQFSVLREEDTKLEAEIQRLASRKAKIVEQMNRTAVELDEANQEAAKELDESKKQRRQSNKAIEERMRAMDRLARCNASWKLFRENLRR